MLQKLRIHQAASTTQQHDEALAELTSRVKGLKYIVHVTLKNDPQLQEALGMVVKYLWFYSARVL